MVDKNVVEDFLRAIQPQDNNTDHTYNATVTKVDKDGVVWVQVAGSDKETPTSSTSSEVKRGDSVNVQWRNNKLYVAGNYSNPSAGTIRVAAVEAAAQVANQAASNAVADAGVARQAAESAQTDAARAKSAADGASEYAARAFGNLSTVQSITETLTWITQHGTMTLTSDVALDPTHVYFVQDAGGDYVVGGVTYAIVTEPDVADIGTYYVLSIDESLNNYVGTHLALTSEGLWLVPEAGGNKVLIATGGVGHTYEDAGTYIIDGSGNVLASFRADGTTIGISDGTQSYLALDYHSMQLIDKEGTTYFHVSDLRDSDGYLADDFVGDGVNRYFQLRTTLRTIIEATINGTPTTAYTASIGSNTIIFTTAPSVGDAIIVKYEPFGADEVKVFTFGERYLNSKVGGGSFSEGIGNVASGTFSHAEGVDVQATAFASHAQNYWTKASSRHQTALGRYNVEDNTNTYAVIVGNGTDNARSNALTVDWTGDVCLALDTTAASGTTDGDLYAAITALNWQSDVIV